MLGRRPWPIWKPFWVIIGPLCILGLWVLSIMSFKHLSYGDGSVFPKWTNYTGLGIALFTIIPVPILGMVEVMKHKGSFLNRLKQSVKPTVEWCPAKSRVDLKISISKPEEEVDSHLL
ncbi:sodium-dependent noradrenaline transporter-like [Octopus bimaculoides]|uniref:sodium-dependent noradrenaline transporter-like n=1 Tax=Octopus bimaculoides TaxID=37653 RepID=UPI0022E7EFBC|nr:sodium-dependent noradrenaline transporter-like [Octopus bimaculoides]